MTLEIWSCNPADIPVWTEYEKARLVAALGQIFEWKNNKMSTELDLKAYEEINGGKYFQHTDGGLYQFQEFARYSDRDGEYAAVYRHIWPFAEGLWVRPKAEWQPDRFKPIPTEAATAIRNQSPELARTVITQRREARKAAAAASTESFNGESSI